MSRDYQKFPDDDNGNTLWQMHQDGDDFSEPHEIEFSLGFSDEITAERCALYLLHEEQKISLVPNPEQANELILTIYISLQPNHADIVDLEAWLNKIATDFKAEYRGWGCMAYVFDDEVDGHS